MLIRKGEQDQQHTQVEHRVVSDIDILSLLPLQGVRKYPPHNSLQWAWMKKVKKKRDIKATQKSVGSASEQQGGLGEAFQANRPMEHEA